MSKITKNVKSQQKCQKLKKKTNMLKITENAKYHQKSQISPNITKIAWNAKTEKAKYHQKCHKYHLPKILYYIKILFTKNEKNHEKWPKSLKMKKILPKMQKTTKDETISENVNNYWKCQNSAKMLEFNENAK